MLVKKNQIGLLTLLATVLLFVLPVRSQVVVGKDSIPHQFSLLELSAEILKGGLRLSQLSTGERDALDINSSPALAEGLIIYNTDNNCLEFWNSTKWVSLCAAFSLSPNDEFLEVTPGDLVFTSAENGGGDQPELVTTNVPAGWQITSMPNWVTTNPSPNIRSTGTSLIVEVSSANTGFLPRIGTITVTAGSLSNTFTVTQEVPEAINMVSSAPLLYIDGSGKLQLGRWGMEVNRDNLLNFKFGGVVGFIIPSSAANGTAWEGSSNVKFDPTNNTASYGVDNYNQIPYYPAALYAQGITNVSSPEYHNGTNVLAGRGDPCKLVGYTGAEIAAMSAVEINNMQSAWRLPTKIEDITFAGADHNTYDNYIPNPPAVTAYIEENPSQLFWGAGPGASPSSPGAWFPIQAPRGVDANKFLPAVGYRGGGIEGQPTNGASQLIRGTHGFYWSSTAYVNNTAGYGYSLAFDAPGQRVPSSGADVYPVSYNRSLYGFPIRCVPNTP